MTTGSRASAGRAGRIALAVALGLLAALLVLPAVVERAANPIARKPPYPASGAAHALIAASQPADLHADPLLWGRNLLKRGARGGVDVPRLLDAGMALQVFSIVTQAPRKMGLLGNDIKDGDLVTSLAVVSFWPPSTWSHRLPRALRQAARLREMAGRSDGRLQLVLTRADLARVLQARARGEQTVGGLLAVEGAQALDGDLLAVDRLYDAGVRMMSPAHFVDTEFAGSAHGVARGGLTPLGREWIGKLEAKRIAVDLAHASAPALAEALSLVTRPVVVSHTGVKGTCNNDRNLSDDQLRALAKNGAVIGIGYWEKAVCGNGAPAIAHAMRYTADLIGVEHVALGSDFDGAVGEPFDVTGLPMIVDAMRAEGFKDDEIKAILGGNALRVLQALLP